METGTQTFTVREARAGDETTLFGLICALAEYEKLQHLVAGSAEELATHLFGPRPVAEALLAEEGGEAVGFALYFTNFSTFLTRPGIYLEDLFVKPAHRGRGIGRALLERLASIAVARGCGRVEWAVLDWNESAIGFYRRLGADVMPDWRLCRLTGAPLRALAEPAT
jgi:hypothetical protein